MQSFRQRVLRLGFVAETADGLDYWNPLTSGDEADNIEYGRMCGADFLAFMRHENAPFLGFHVTQAWRAKKDASLALWGFVREMAEVLTHAPRNRLATSPILPPSEGLYSIPYLAPGTPLPRWTARPSGDLQADQALGRFIGDATAAAIRESGDKDILLQVSLAARARDDAPETSDQHIRCGMVTALCEAAMSAPAGCTSRLHIAESYYLSGGDHRLGDAQKRVSRAA